MKEANGAYVPHLTGCVAVGETEEDARELISEAIALHVEEMRQSGESIPEPQSVVGYVEIAAAG